MILHVHTVSTDRSGQCSMIGETDACTIVYLERREKKRENNDILEMQIFINNDDDNYFCL